MGPIKWVEEAFSQTHKNDDFSFKTAPEALFLPIWSAKVGGPLKWVESMSQNQPTGPLKWVVRLSGG